MGPYVARFFLLPLPLLLLGPAFYGGAPSSGGFHNTYIYIYIYIYIYTHVFPNTYQHIFQNIVQAIAQQLFKHIFQIIVQTSSNYIGRSRLHPRCLFGSADLHTNGKASHTRAC